MRAIGRVMLGALIALMGSVVLIPEASAANPVPMPIPNNAGWLDTVNYFREMAYLPDVTEGTNLDWKAGAINHSCYMLYNDMTHDELTNRPGYTWQGDAVGNAANVAVSTNINATTRSFIELWMSGPFHAIGLLRPNLQQVNYGECRLPTTAKWHSAATLDVIHGLPSNPQTSTVLFPGPGTVTSLDRFIAESPNPVTLCGWNPSTAAGLPIVAMMPAALTSNPSAALYGPNGVIPSCVLSARNTTGLARDILAANNAIVIVPRSILPQGDITVVLNSSAGSPTWTFTVDALAANTLPPTPTASPVGGAAGWVPITPARFVDSRISKGATRLLANSTKRVKLTGRLGLPDGVDAITANFTVTDTAGEAYLTVWNCSSPMPVASTLNFRAADTVANATSVPLDASGYVCLYSPTSMEIIIDVVGYYAPSATSEFTPTEPDRVMDTRTGVGYGRIARMPANSTFELRLPDAPSAATGALLNVTTVDALADGYVTVYPCGTLPPTSSVNQTPGKAVPNTVTTALSANKSICIYTYSTVNVVVDVFGYFATDDGRQFTPSAPFRWMDTRYRFWPDLNFGSNGYRINPGQEIRIPMAGQRGIPSTAKAVSVNLTVVDGTTIGHLSAYPCGTTPTTSNVNFVVGSAVANGAVVSLSSTGFLCITSPTFVHVVIDTNGWWS